MRNGILAHNLTDSQAKLLSSKGINWIRADVSLNQSEPWQTIYQLAKDNNLSLIGTLLPYTMNFNNTFTLDDWKQTIQTAIDKYGDNVSAWEIWNEPTAPNSTCGYFNGTAQQYVDLMNATYKIIKDHSNATVLGFGGLPLYSGDSTYLNQSLNFAQQVIDIGGMNCCDAISLHAYPWGHDNPSVENAYNNSISTYRTMTGKDVWITETGQESVGEKNQFTEQEQAVYLNVSFTFFKSENVNAFIWYELTDSYNYSSTFGLYTADLIPKAALETYFDLAATSTTIQTQMTTEPSTSKSATIPTLQKLKPLS
jgi:hypothetical protein